MYILYSKKMHYFNFPLVNGSFSIPYWAIEFLLPLFPLVIICTVGDLIEQHTAILAPCANVGSQQKKNSFM